MRRALIVSAWLVALGCHDKALSTTESAALAPLLSGTAPALVGPLAGLRFGMSIDEARHAAPLLINSDRDDLDQFATAIHGFAGAELRVAFGSSGFHLDAIHIDVPARDVRSSLIERWGPPVSVQWLDETVWIWRNPTARVRAMLRRVDAREIVVLEPYVPAIALIDSIEAGGPFVGASLDELRGKLGPRLHEESATEMAESQARIAQHAPSPIDFGDAQPLKSIGLPPVELAVSATPIFLTYRGDSVTALSLRIESSGPEMDRALEAATRTRDTPTRHVVVERTSDHQWELTISAR